MPCNMGAGADGFLDFFCFSVWGTFPSYGTDCQTLRLSTMVADSAEFQQKCEPLGDSIGTGLLAAACLTGDRAWPRNAMLNTLQGESSNGWSNCKNCRLA